jgi:two-component system chemotaxis sensor kinase CheA
MKPSQDPFNTFIEEVKELLEGLEQLLIHLENHPQDLESIHTAFRHIHTIKGSGAMFGLDPLTSFTHTVENVFDKLRDGNILLTSELITLILQSKDVIEQLSTREPSIQSILESQRLISLFIKILGKDIGPDSEPKGSTNYDTDLTTQVSQTTELLEPLKTFRIEFHPHSNLFITGNNPLFLLKELKDFGQNEIIGLTYDVPELDELDPEKCYLSWEILLHTQKTIPEIRDIFLFVDDQGVLAIDLLDQPEVFEQHIGYKRLGEILIERGIVKKHDLERAIGTKGYLGEILVQMGLASQEDIHKALEEQKFVRQVQAEQSVQETSSTIKVNTEKLNELVNLVGEFVSLQARLGLTADQKQDQEFRSLSEQLDTLVREFRDLSISMHMVPISLLFSSFRRLVRDVSQELGKEVLLEFEGADTELDKTIIDLLKDPLLHLIRNSIDHGIEIPPERITQGKTPQGTIKLSAHYVGTSVILTIFDDGRGINQEKVLNKAIEQGIIDPTDQLSPQEILQLIFVPGFSTAENTTSISGRGVGMDVVKKNIEDLRGSIKVDSKEGRYTNISLRIPLTLAIVEGLLASIAGDTYLINLAFIQECLQYKDLNKLESGKVIDYRGTLVPLIDLSSQFRTLKQISQDNQNVSSQGCLDGNLQDLENNQHSKIDLENKQVLILSSEDHKVGIVLDQLLDPYQSIVKSLGPLFLQVHGIGGAIILGDGTPALLIDADAYIQLALQQESNQTRDCLHPKTSKTLTWSASTKDDASDLGNDNISLSHQKYLQFLSSEEHLFLMFTLGKEQFAIEIELIEEVIEYSNLVFVPGATNHLEGIINVRGRILPVIDLGGFLSVSNYSKSITDSTRIIIVQSYYQGESISVGLRVDLISGIRSILGNQIQPMIKDNQSGIPSTTFWGLANIPDSPISILIHIEALFT